MIDTRNWRVGIHYGIHGYAENDSSGDDEPIFTALTRSIADQIVADHKSQIHCRTEVVDLIHENRKLKAELAKAHQRIAKLQANALRTVGTARRAHNVLRELLEERTASIPDAADTEAVCE
jgi:phage shock protein A